MAIKSDPSGQKIHLKLKCRPQNSLCDFDASHEEWRIFAKFALINLLFMISLEGIL